MMFKNKALALAAALILCLATAGVTAAYFTDYESAEGGAIIELSGQTRLKEEVNENNKNVSIVNTGATDMIVRVAVFSDMSRTAVNAGSDWIRGSDGWYYYRYILKGSADGKGGDSTSTLNVVVQTGGQEASPDFDVLVAHESSQAVYDGQSEPGAADKDLTLIAPDGWDSSAVSQIKAKN